MIPAETWAKAKADYETGNYSIIKLAQKHAISRESIKVRASEEKWQKGKLKPIIEKSVQEEFLKHFTKLGFDRRKVSKVIKEMSEAEKTIIVPSGQEGQSGFADTLPDWQARDKAITQYAKLTGAYAAEKVDHQGLQTPPPQLEVVIKNAAN